MFIAIVVGGVLGWYYWSKKKKNEKGDTIIITENGSKIEKYIEMPRFLHCINGINYRDRPEFCNDINKDTEMNYVYDVGGELTVDGGWKTRWDKKTNKCADGTSSCLYEEKYDAERNIISITNEEGEDFIKNFIEDLWSGRIKFDGETILGNERISMKEAILKSIDFNIETGELFLKENGLKAKAVPVISSKMLDSSGELATIPLGMMILYIIFHYYANNLPKPTINLKIKSEKTLGQVYIELLNTIEKTTTKPSSTPKLEEPPTN